MGNTSGTSAAATAFAPTGDTARRSPSEDEAWDVATAWTEELREIVVASPGIAHYRADSRGAADSIVQYTDWVDFYFQCIRSNARKDVTTAVCAARAATVAWFALSCCPGFSGAENPQFWRRVLRHYDKFSAAASDTVRFFDHPDRPFPRVRINGKAGFEDLPVRLFFSTPPIQWRDKKLEAALRSLQPCMDAARWQREIPVSLSSVQTAKLAIALKAIQFKQKPVDAAPWLRLTSVFGRDEQLPAGGPVDAIMEDTEATVYVYQAGIDAILTRIPPLQDLHCLHIGDEVDIPSQRIQIAVARLQERNPRRAHDDFQVCCSMLPSCQLVAGVRVSDTLSRADAAWLGYAIFHPDSSTYRSSFNELTIKLTALDLSTIAVLEGMAQGNYLAQALNLTSESASVYYTQARLRPGATIYSSSDVQSSALVAFDAEVVITLCALQPTSTTLICVVVPGHGLGWVERESILDCVDKPPADSRIRRLHLELPREENPEATGLLGLLSILGEHLSSLYVVSSQDLSVAIVAHILQRCPNLKTLSIHHDGSCWSDTNDPAEIIYPRLKELHLTTKGTLQPLAATKIRDLRAFKVMALFGNKLYANRDTFLDILASVRQIEYAIFEKVLPATHEEIAYREGRIVQGVHDVAHVPLRLASRLAFLSVLRGFGSLDLCGKLVPDDARLIFAFSSSIVPRNLSMDDRR